MYWQDLEIELEYITKIYDRVKYVSPLIADYFRRLGIETDTTTIKNTADNVGACCKSWFSDSYKMQAIKDVRSWNICKNKFCPNCQKLMQASRLNRFGPELDRLAQEYDLYHITFNPPSCSAERLPETIDRIFESHKHLLRYFKGNTRIKGIDFEQYGYQGCLRALEVTYDFRKRSQGHEYNPHIHCIFALRKGIELKATIENKFSYRRGGFDRFFTEFEVMLQRIFKLLYNDQKVTLKAIKELELGYNSVALKVNKNYYEVFKYAFKGFGEDKKIMTYEQFKTLFFAFYKRRCIQGYGVLYNLAADDEIDESVNEFYNEFIEKLKMVETPESTSNTIDEVHNAIARKFTLFISRKNIHKVMRQLAKQDDASYIEKLKVRNEK